MNLDELSAEVNLSEKPKEVSNADMLASLVIIQSQLQKCEKVLYDNQKVNQKNYAEIKDILASHDKNISAIPVLTANIITDKTDKIVPQINEASNTFGNAIAALNQSNVAFKTFLQVWIGTLALCLVLIISFVLWR